MATYGSTLRRGLPRVTGGEPWPPAAERDGVGVVDDIETKLTNFEVDVPEIVKVMTAFVAGIAADHRALLEQDAERPPRPLRRGLPRVVGGDPWPPAVTVYARPLAAFVPEDAEQGTANTATRPELQVEAVAEPVGAPARKQRTGLPRPGTAAPAAAVATPTAVAEAEAGASVPAATTAVAVFAGLRAPLRVPRTAWPGVAGATTRPAPQPEPQRIGPFTRGQWAGAVIVGGAGLLFAAGMVVLFVRWFLSLDFMVDFLAAYPGEYELPEGAPVGMPGWLGWQHFFNVFLMVLIIRSGLQVRTEKRPSVFWTPRGNKKGKISLNLWFHQGLDVLWLVNGVIFVVLLFTTGQWMKIVPTSWEVFPNAISAALQYVSLDWPTENGWVNYNSLQQLAYFATVFLAAPLAAVTGYRMSGFWPKQAAGLNKAYPVEWARAVHFPVMLYFVLFIFVHVVLVIATGALRNLNHMYASQDAVNWTGFWIFSASIVVIAGAWVAARPLVLAPIARLFGNVTRG